MLVNNKLWHDQSSTNPGHASAEAKLPFPMQGLSSKPPVVLVHGQSGGGYFFEYPQPALGAPTGLKGLLEDAGYDVFNPSLPYHNGPADAYNISDGAVSANDYAQSLASVRCLPSGCLKSHAFSTKEEDAALKGMWQDRHVAAGVPDNYACMNLGC